jgi:hypothetical protein
MTSHHIFAYVATWCLVVVAIVAAAYLGSAAHRMTRGNHRYNLPPCCIWIDSDGTNNIWGPKFGGELVQTDSPYELLGIANRLGCRMEMDP